MSRWLSILILAAAPYSAAWAERAVEPDTHNLEVMLVNSMMSVTGSNLDRALQDVDALLKINPNFRLAQLIKGDLLLARAQPINAIGNIANAPKDKIEDLREEARIRVQRTQDAALTEKVPGYLWQLNEQQRYVVVIDTGRSTLYLYENINGQPHYVTDYYISIGKAGPDKWVEGDQKTPLGIYFISDNLPRSRLTDFYGSGAYPINYPNEWDRRLGRNGYGIWLHGTPSDTYSRPPRASNGCVVLTNADMEALGNYLQVDVTPVVITDQMEWRNEQSQADREALLQALEQWRTDWASLDTDAYLAHYSPDFSAGKTRYAAWAKQKKQVNAGKSWIKVEMTNLSVFSYPNEPGLAVVTFEQDYSSNNLNNRMKKRQYWKNTDNRWQIIFEGPA